MSTWNNCTIPPCACRLLAAKGDRCTTDKELMDATGWSKYKLRVVYQRKDWGHVTIEDQANFLAACGIELSKQRRYRLKLKRALDSPEGIRRLKHLQPTSCGWQAVQQSALINMCEKVLEHE